MLSTSPHLIARQCSDDIDLKNLATELHGYTGADIEAVCREAGLVAMRANAKSVNKSHFEEAVRAIRPTITPDMLDYYNKLETRLMSGMDSIRRGADSNKGMEAM